MDGDFLQMLKEPNRVPLKESLDRTGLAIEYFPAFEQRSHDFHTHNFIEILFVAKGRFRHIIADRTYDESTGGLTILNYRQFHSLRTPEGPVELYNVYWNPSLYSAPSLPDEHNSILWDLIPQHPSLSHKLNRVRHFLFADHRKTTELLKMLYEEQQSGRAASEQAIQALFQLFLIEICRTAPLPQAEQSVLSNGLMERVRIYLDQHFTEIIPLDTLCRISGLNASNLCRRFKGYTGMSTGEYLKQRRLSAALRRLRLSDDKVLTICHDCGFPDISRFNNYFRNATGQTPSEYRKSFASKPEIDRSSRKEANQKKRQGNLEIL